jgi:hypothetical protein
MVVMTETARLNPWASVARRLLFALSAVLLAGLGLVLVYWGAVGVVVFATGPWWATPFALLSAGVGLLPVAAAAAATVAALTDGARSGRWTVRLAATKALALGLLFTAPSLLS